jgi:integrase
VCIVTLPELAAAYFVGRDVSAMYRGNFLAVVAAYAAWSGGCLADQLREDRVAAWLTAVDGTVSRRTVKNMRAAVLMIWREASRRGVTNPPCTDRVPILKIPPRLVECYTRSEVTALIRTAQQLAGTHPDGIPQATYWMAILRVAWDTGLRRGDVLGVRADQLRPGGILVTLQSKTGRAIVHRLHPQTAILLRRVRTLEYPYSANTWSAIWRQIRDRSKVCRGSFKWLRRSSGSYVAAEHGLRAGAEHLGHASIETFRRHYDAAIAHGARRPMPPAVG